MCLPGIGAKTAQRLAFFVVKMDSDDVFDFSKALIRVKRDLKTCIKCGSLTEAEYCNICKDQNRDSNTICIVQEARDVLALERTEEYRGLYHVLHGVISPLEGIGPDELNIATLVSRLRDKQIQEVILATNPNIEGEATAMYISKLVASPNIKITRLAHGLPMGGDLEYADEVTLIKALEGRREI